MHSLPKRIKPSILVPALLVAGLPACGPIAIIVPTLSPKPLPAATATLIPAVISPSKPADLTQLARWGKGLVNEVVWSPSGEKLAVASSLGIYLHDAEELRDAMRDPEKYRHLRVRMGGWTAYFCMLGREQQELQLQRAIHGG